MSRNNRLTGVVLGLLFSFQLYAQEASVYSPDKNVQVNIFVQEGKPHYSVVYKGKNMLDNSPLGLKTNEGDFTSGMKYLSKKDTTLNTSVAFRMTLVL